MLTGPRQSGKTTLAREILFWNSVNYFDLEDPVSLARLEEPGIALEPLQYRKGERLINLSFYMAPDELFDDPEEARIWATRAYEAALRSGGNPGTVYLFPLTARRAQAWDIGKLSPDFVVFTFGGAS